MKQFLLAAAVLTASLYGTASAADLARPRAHAVYGPAVAFYNWTGCYVGGNGGGFWARREWSDPVFGRGGFGDETASGGLGGVQVGATIRLANGSRRARRLGFASIAISVLEPLRCWSATKHAACDSVRTRFRALSGMWTSD